MKKPYTVTALLAVVLALAQPALAQVTVFDPVNYAKNTLTELNTLQITINQATQISNELRQLAYEVRNLQNIPSGVWGQIRSDLDALKQIAKVGRSISYADRNLSSEFSAMYPGYVVPTDYTRAYAQWAQNALGGMQGALASAGLQSSQLASEDAVFTQLQALSDSAAGHMQAIQVGNMIGIQQVQQLQKLRQLQMAQLQGQFGYLATQQQNDLSRFATLRAWLDSQKHYKSRE
ncbi:MAG: P-type conjugative transfer protein TrbJ [Candidatus Eremiobacteraeota bacterium]|nr:P-type conjugative transfer protein TrbJ [Candidatus Eremiobacteraeota bacterium]